ncbi:MAG: ABC transporter ATP-binding protein [Planctomycetaceae bacterium]|jgi:NitT/TauT family transport system ATP-binding protein|nr:ABC transporter ATP-binding protein [Planctomycetaceae bacterium]
MISINNVSFRYSDKLVLDNISAETPSGQFVCLLGQSGCGKSTLLRLLAGLSAANTGTIHIDGKPVSGPEKKCSVVFQDYSLFPWMTTGENLMLALRNSYPEKKRKDVRFIAEEYLEVVGLCGCFNKFPGALSGGMRQRAAIARSLSVGSSILLLDEPFGAIDPLNRTLLQDLLLNLWRNAGEKRTVFFVTHDIDEAVFLSQRIIVLGSTPGRIIADWEVPKKEEGAGRGIFDLPEFKEFQSQLLTLYREDILRRLESGSIQQNGSGI